MALVCIHFSLEVTLTLALCVAEQSSAMFFLYSSAQFKTNLTYPFLLLLVIFVFVFLFLLFLSFFIPRADRGVVYMHVLEKFGGFGGFVATGLGGFEHVGRR